MNIWILFPYICWYFVTLGFFFGALVYSGVCYFVYMYRSDTSTTHGILFWISLFALLFFGVLGLTLSHTIIFT